MHHLALRIAPLLFCSGLCALIYQTAWLRELRLIFGASTEASAAVLAIFMGGLGLGGALLGRKADLSPRPLLLYAWLEAGIALSAAVTPALTWLAFEAYTGLGGTVVLGTAGGTLARLALAVAVLGTPTLLMGGTLPAVAKAAASEQDTRRRSLALLYGANTLGAVAGTVLSTFFLLEVFGSRTTLWMACLLNGLVALTARAIARGMPQHAGLPTSVVVTPADAVTAKPSVPLSISSRPLPHGGIYAAAAAVGLTFLLMELVWYRMLAPLLGGSSYTFGLILAVALLGIGLGGAAYAAWGSPARASLEGFALTCAAEALCMGIPFAMGDHVASLALLLKPLGTMGLGGHVLGWGLVTGLVVFPAAFVSGVQFPLLIALLGQGGMGLGRQVGLAYAWNTVGSIAGSLAGGFGLMPLLAAPGCWKASVALLAVLALWSAVLAGWRKAPLAVPGCAVACALAAVATLTARGPTPAWRHSAVGVGSPPSGELTINTLKDWQHQHQRAVVWEREGVESSVAVRNDNGLAFVVNGKVDGNAWGDMPTQLMGGVVGAILHDTGVRHALVVGLGTGSTAGWLGVLPDVERVDVVELEPAIVEVAAACAPVNQDVLNNPRVHLVIGDAREVLFTTPARYDLIFSEPSNPYRAGISSLFTVEFYHAVRQRLAEGGLFLQWLQSYDVDAQTVRTVYASLGSVFPHVSTWQTQPGSDMLLVASVNPLTAAVPVLRARVEQEPFKSALAWAWRVDGLEGFLARHVATPALAHQVAQEEAEWVSTDDRTLVEYGFARGLGLSRPPVLAEIARLAGTQGLDRPQLTGGQVDWAAVQRQRLTMFTAMGWVAPMPAGAEEKLGDRAQCHRLYLNGQLALMRELWRLNGFQPGDPVERAMWADALADGRDPETPQAVAALRAFNPVEADLVLGRLHWREGRLADAADALEAAFSRVRKVPFAWSLLVQRSLDVAVAVAREAARTDGALARRILAMLSQPLALDLHHMERQTKALRLAMELDAKGLCVETLAPLEPHVPWNRETLTTRLACYHATQHPRLEQAQRDLEEFLAAEPMPFSRHPSTVGSQ